MTTPLARAPLVLLLTVLSGCDLSESGTDADPTTLLAAAERGDLGALNALLERTPDPNVRDACQWTPLMRAALNGHRDAVLRLLAAGARVDAEDSGGYTAMMLAASRNHVELLELLLASGAMPDHQEHTRGWTALIWASVEGHTESVQQLLGRGADRTLRDTEGMTAADWARVKGHDRVLRLLDSARPADEPGPTVGPGHAGGYDSAHAQSAREDGSARIRVQ